MAMKKMIGMCFAGLLLWTTLCQAQPIPEGDTYPGPLPAAWGMTLTAMPSAQLSTWTTDWDSNITNQCSTTSSYSYRMFQSAMGKALDWLLTPPAEGLYYGYMATGNTKYVSWFVSCVDQMIARAVTEPDGYPGWPQLDASGTDGDGGVGNVLAGYTADSMLGEAAVFRPIALMAYQMINNPQLQAQYAAKGHTYLTLAERIYAKWVARGGWQATSVNGVSGEMSVVMPQGLSADYTSWVTYSTNPTGGMSHPCNKANEVARWMLAMYDVTGDSQYLTHAQKWFTLMKSRMSTGTDHYATVDTYGNVVWNYWEPAGPWDYTSGTPNLWIGVHPRNGYYAINTTAIVEAYEHGVVFTNADIAPLVHIAKTDWASDVSDYEFDPSALQVGMSISVYPASGTATQLNACFPTSLTAQAISAGAGALNGTIVSTTWNGGTGTGSTVVQPNGGGSPVTITTNTSTSMLMLREWMWTGMAPYDTQIQTSYQASESATSLSQGWGELSSVPWWLMLQSELTLGTGSVQVTLGPAGAITAGAQWNVDGGVWQSSGATVTGLSPGSHDVYFNTVAGWGSPVSAPVTITASTTTPVTGTYLQLAGSLTVELTPADALAAGAQWKVGGGAWQSSGATVGGLTVGSGYTVNYNTLSAWATPPSASVTISSNGATTATANYLQQAGAPFMTLAPLPLATWQGWLSLWDENIVGEYSWELNVIPTGFAAYGGMAENLDWQLAPVLTGFCYGYMATADTKYVDMMVTCVDEMIGLAVIEPDGYPGWPAPDPDNQAPYTSATYNADSLLGEAAMLRPVVLLAYQMTTNPALKAKYGAKGQSYIQLAEQVYTKWVSRGGWRDTAGGGMMTVILPYGMDPTNSYWIDYDTRNNPGNGFSHPENKANEVALWMLAMWDVTGNPEYKIRAQKWFTLLKSRMTLQGGANPDGVGNLIWNYWQPAGPWDYVDYSSPNPTDPKLWVGVHPNNGYYQIDTQCIVAAFEHGLVFTEADITPLITSAKTSWTPSAWEGVATEYYFNPSALAPGMSVSAWPASGTVQQVCGCIPNSLTPLASSAWPTVQQWTGVSGAGALNGTIVSVTWNGSTGTIVIQPSGGGSQVTLDTDKNTTEVWLLRMWTSLLPYDVEIQQQFEENEDANPATAYDWGPVYDSYYLWLHSTLTVQSTPPTGLSIGSSLGQSGTTNYTIPGSASGTTVNLQAPAADPAGYTFAQWAVNGTSQTAGLKSITFARDGPTTAAAQYTTNAYALNVQSTPLTGLSIGSSAGDGGTTNYTVSSVAYGTSVNLQAPATDPTGTYTFSQWMLNGAAQTAGQTSIGFTMAGATTAVAQYTLNTYTLNVQSTPPTGLVITSSTGDGGTTNYTVPGIASGTSVNLAAPDTDPAGCTFLQWTVNGTPQTAGQKSITFTLTAATTAVAVYTLNADTLAVQSAPPIGIVITSSTGDGGTTNYTVPSIVYGTSVNLQAPAADPAGYTFSRWAVNGAAQTAGQKSITFTLTAATTAVAQYMLNTYTLTVQSAPPTGLTIGSSTGLNGTTNYTKTGVGYGASVNLQAPAADPAGYTFSQWTVNGTAQTAGQKSITFTLTAATTAVAQYTLNTYTLSVQSTPPTGLSIGSSTGHSGTTNYSKTGLAYGASVNLAAPSADPAGYIFLQWTVNGTAQTGGQKSISFTMSSGTTAVAQYTLNTYTLTVQSTPPTGLIIGSSTGQNGTTNYSKTGLAYGASVNLVAPSADPAGYTFSRWAVNGAAQTAGQKSVTFTLTAATAAVAQYTLNTYTLSVQSTPSSGLSIGSSTGHSGTTNYSKTGLAYGASVNLQAPATNPAGYIFLQWTVNGTAQTAGQKSITFTLTAATTAVAQYTLNTYPLIVQSMPPTGLLIGSSTGQGGTTMYTIPLNAYGASVNLQAPSVDPAGYTFSRWTLNGAAQTAGQKSITFRLTATTAAVAQYTLNTYTLSVQSTPPTGVLIGSNTGDGGTTNYTKTGVGYEVSVNLQAPSVDPAGYTFSRWTLNGAAQTAGQKSFTFAMSSATTAVAQYTLNTYPLAVQSADINGNPLPGISITGTYPGTTNYAIGSIAYSTNVNLVAPATDPAGYTFSQWTVNGAAQTAGQKSITFTLSAATTAVAQYILNSFYTLTVQSTPVTGLSIASNTGNNGTTNYYTQVSVTSGTSVNLQAPATDPDGYIFAQWTVNGTAQTAGQKSITFTITADATAVAQYSVLGTPDTLTVQSTPPTGLVITSSGADGGTTNYTVSDVASGTSVNLAAPATDPAGSYTFSQWLLNGVAQTSGQQAITFTMAADTTAVAQYTLNTYTLTVQSTPPTGLSIGSSTGNNGTTSYTNTVAYGTSVNLAAPATDPTGYTFSQWTLNGTAQTAAQKSITFTLTAATTAVAQYKVNTCTLTVQSTPPTGIVIASSGADGGTTNYTLPSVAYGTSVNLQAPSADPTGYTFSRWAVNGAAQTAGQKSITFTLTAATTAVAQYTVNTYTLTVQSTPPTGLTIGSSTGLNGTTNYTKTGVGYGASVNLQAPSADPAGYTFSQWTVNGAAQTAGQKSITFALSSATTAVAQYTLNTCTLTVQSTPPTGMVITSSSADGGTTNYTVSGVASGTSVNLVAPSADPVGYIFSQWTVNGTAQTAGQKSITFTLTAATTAVAQYTLNTYPLIVQSMPPTGLLIGSSTGQGGTTMYTIPLNAYGASVNLQAPSVDPAGYTFSRWTLNGAAQTAGQKSITFRLTATTAAVAQYTLNTYTLSVQSTPPTGLLIGANAGYGGTTNYTKTGVGYQSSVNLRAPATDPAGYTFSQWTVNGTAQPAGQKSITFIVTAATTAVAVYVTGG